MRVILQKADFLAELNVLRSVFGEKDNQTANIHMSADQNGMTLVSTDARARIVGKVNAKVVKDGMLAIHGTTFLNLVKLLPSGEITMEAAENGFLAIEAGGFNATLPASVQHPNALHADEGYDRAITLKGDDLARMVANTRFIIGRAEEKPLTKGALLELADGAARMVTTDGHRLAISGVGQLPDDTAKLFVAKRAAGQLKALLDQYKGDVEVRFSNRAIHVIAGDRQLTALLIVDSFPPYRRIIPTDPATKVTVNVTALQHAIKRTTLLANSLDECDVLMHLSEGQIRVECHDLGEGDTAEESVDADVVGGQIPRVLKIGGRYIVEALDVFEDDVTFSIQAAEQRPIAIQSAANPGDEMQIVMPMAIEKKKEKEKPKGKKNAKAA